ncbi:hypothetical protein M0805_004419 [Coniferiporia weirii]|nr:hypothetical protein M0805_004419 [Coniferiporia weirii]
MPAVTTISAAPSCISPDEHRERTAATPASFADIPPVLQHKEQNVQAVFDPPFADLSEDELKNGTVYIIESLLAFVSATSGRGFQIEYPSITLHAISRGDSASCIYCHLDESPQPDGVEANEDEDDASMHMRELRIVPENPSSLDALFEALSFCASLHPDPAASDDDDDDMGLEDDDDAFVDADVEAIQEIVAQGVDAEPELSEAGRAALERLESLIQDPHGKLREAAEINGHGGDAAEESDGDDGRFSDAEALRDV